MSAQTSIEWTDRTWNPTRGCSRVSSGCDHCYAMREARRHDHPGGAYEGLTRIGKRGVDWSGRVRLAPEQLDEPLRWKKPQKVFVNSMSDLFHESLSAVEINHVFAAMYRARQHTFQVLTKRPQRMLAFFAWARVANATVKDWPLPNVWLGVSVEDQDTADARIPLLLQTPAAVRFVSYEPALGPVDFKTWWFTERSKIDRFEAFSPEAKAAYPVAPTQLVAHGVDWLIVGGESGPGARPFDVAWARAVVAQCKAAGVPVFLKQLGSRPFQSPRHDGGTGYVLALKNRKGGDMSEWDEDLRVREFPNEPQRGA